MSGEVFLDTIYSEDLGDGQEYFGIRVEDPFKSPS